MSPECAAESSIVLRHVGFEMLRERHQVFSDAGDVLARREAEVGERSTVHRSLSCCLGAPEFKSRHKFQLVEMNINSKRSRFEHNLAGDRMEHDVERCFL